MKKYALYFSILVVFSVVLFSCGQKSLNKMMTSSAASKSGSQAKSSVTSASSSSSDNASGAASSSSVHESSDPKVKEYYTAAIANYVQKNYTQAINFSEKALALDPQCYEALNVKGIARYYSSGNPDDGLPYINQSLAINPNYQYAYFCKAMIYKGKKDWDTSISLFQKSIELKPDDPWSYYGISTIYADRNMIKESLDYLKIAIQKDPSVKETAKTQNHYIKMRSNPEFQALVK